MIIITYYHHYIQTYIQSICVNDAKEGIECYGRKC